MRRKRASKGIFIDIALLLTCLVCITTCISSGILAKFATGSQSKTGGRVAQFAVSASGDAVAGEENEYMVTVRNDSDTAVSYSIELRFKSSVENVVSAKLGDTVYTANGDTIRIDNIGILAPHDGTEQRFELILNAEPDEPGEIAFDTIVRFVQVD